MNPSTASLSLDLSSGRGTEGLFHFNLTLPPSPFDRLCEFLFTSTVGNLLGYHLVLKQINMTQDGLRVCQELTLGLEMGAGDVLTFGKGVYILGTFLPSTNILSNP